MIPQLEYKFKGDNMYYRWTNTVPGFAMQVKLENGEWLKPASEWKNTTVTGALLKNGLKLDKNFYVTVKKIV